MATFTLKVKHAPKGVRTTYHLSERSTGRQFQVTDYDYVNQEYELCECLEEGYYPRVAGSLVYGYIDTVDLVAVEEVDYSDHWVMKTPDKGFVNLAEFDD